LSGKVACQLPEVETATDSAGIGAGKETLNVVEPEKVPFELPPEFRLPRVT
jgi:hypothetical protein